jgi:hypothetical protein
MVRHEAAATIDQLIVNPPYRGVEEPLPSCAAPLCSREPVSAPIRVAGVEA